MKAKNHWIQKPQFLLTLSPEVDAFRAQHSASRFFREAIVPALEKIFDELCGQDEVIRLNTCEIDLGVLSPDELQKGFLSDAQFRRIRDAVRRVVEKEAESRPDLRETLREGVLARWWYYMGRGRLPWNADRLTEDDLRKVLELFSLDHKAITRLRQELEGKPRFLVRIAAQHTDWFLENLVAVLTASGQEGLGEAIHLAGRMVALLESIHRVWTTEISTPAPEASQPDGPDRQDQRVSALRKWARLKRPLLQTPSPGRREWIWRKVLIEAAGRPRWTRDEIMDMLLQLLFDSVVPMEILLSHPEIADSREPFAERFREYYARKKSSHRPVEAPDRPGGRQHPTTRPADHSLSAEEWTRALQRWVLVLDGFPEMHQEEKEASWRRLLTEAVAWPGVSNEFVRMLKHRLQQLSLTDSWPALQKIAIKEYGAGDAPFIQLLRVYRKEKPDDRPEPPEPVHPIREDKDVPGREKEPVFGPGGEEVMPRPEEEVVSGRDEGVVSGPREEALFDREDEVVFDREEISEEEIYMTHAGLILVHPFLSTFFNRCGLWNGVAFTDVPARQRAVYLLHFLATGETRPPEYELVFPKLLCGYSLEMPLPGDIALTEEECAEGLLLLENVLQRWEKLQNSSITGLREGFLRRSGKLSSKGGRICLQVESSGIDVLLDFLPWNLSLVKLPWLKDLIYVEWR